MRCPFCQNPCHEETAECAHCGFSLDKLDHYLGSVPPVKEGISDRADRLSSKDKSRINAAIARLQKRFPQVSFTVLVDHVKPEIPLHLYAFWIFNRSTVCAKLATGAVNRNIFLVIDAIGSRSSMIIGYGLEPFMGAQHLNAILENARPELTAENYAGGVLTVLDGLMDTLKLLHTSLRQTYGAEASEMGIEQNSKHMVGPNGLPIY